MHHSLTGWDIASDDEVASTPWGARGEAHATLLASADGFHLTVVRVPPGHREPAHAHEHPELLDVVAGRVRVQGHLLGPGDGYAAAAASLHDDRRADTGATYVAVSKW